MHREHPYSALLFYTYIAMSLATFMLYGIDKWQAKKKAWRIPEKKLHLCSVLGGWPGALLAQQIFRHKTQKSSFRLVFWLTLSFNLLILVLFLTPLGEKLWNQL